MGSDVYHKLRYNVDDQIPWMEINAYYYGFRPPSRKFKNAV